MTSRDQNCVINSILSSLRSQAEREPEPFEQDCDCCSILDRRIGMRDVNLTCAHNNSVVTHTQFLSVALRCGCSPCGQ